MKLRKIAFRNLAAYKKHYIKLLCEFVALIFLVSLFVSFSLAANDEQNEIKNENISANNIVSDSVLADNIISEKISWMDVSKIDQDSMREKTGFRKDISVIDLLAIVGTEKINSRDNYDSFCAFFDDNWDIFSENDFREIGATDRDPSRFLLGRFPQAADEIVVTSTFLKSFGLDESMLNKKITFVAKYDESLVLADNATICGILTDEYCNLSRFNVFSTFSPTILVHEQNKFFPNCLSKKIFVGSLQSWPSAETVNYLQQSNTVKYEGGYYLQQVEFINKIQQVLTAVVLYVAMAIVFALLSSVFVSLVKLREAMFGNSSMLLTLGLTHRQLTETFLLQFVVVLAVSFVVAAALTVGAFFGLNKLLSTALGLSLSFTFTSFLVVFFLAFSLICLLTMLIVTFFSHGLRYRK